MRQKLIVILRYTAALLMVFGAVLLIPALVALFSEKSLHFFASFALPGLGSLLLGVFLLAFFRKRQTPLTLANSMILCTFSWTLLSLVGAIPFLFIEGTSFLHAFFEAVAGLTTTGFTLFTQLHHLPFSILLWRAMMQWLGGLGILTFFLLITSSNEGDLWHLFSAEGHKIASARPVPNVFRTVKILWLLYIFFSFILFLILFLMKLPLSEVILHTLSTISTGGFSGHDLSMGGYQGMEGIHLPLLEYVTILFMTIGGMNFLVHYQLFRGELHALWTQIETRTYFLLIGLATSLLFLGMALGGQLSTLGLEASFRTALFHVVSMITSTGYTTEPLTSPIFPLVSQQIFFLLMIIGGSVGSTSGGLKVMRIVLLEKLFKREVKKITLPRKAVSPIVVDHSVVHTEELTKVAALVSGWLLLIALGAIITSLFTDLDAFASVSGMASAVGNMGPLYYSPDVLIHLPAPVKITYIIGMLAGRLELLPIAVIMTRRAWQ